VSADRVQHRREADIDVDLNDPARGVQSRSMPSLPSLTQPIVGRQYGE
jgi:hypothetical protein